MERYDRLYRLYEEFDTGTLRSLQDFVDLFPPVDSRVVLEHWEEVNDELEAEKAAVRDAFPEAGETFADVAARATREQAFTALDLHATYGRAVNALVLDVDETLRSAGGTDNEIPRETLHLLTEFHADGVPIVVCTGQTLENVKGFLIQGLGNAIVHSGSLSVVYEAGAGVFTPGHGAGTKQLLYADLDDDVRRVFDALRSRVLSDAPEALRRGCHLQGNEFNVTMKPNFEAGSERSREVVDEALVYELDLLGDVVADVASTDESDEGSSNGPVDEGSADDAGSVDDARGSAVDGTAASWTRAFYADRDPEIRAVLEGAGGVPEAAAEDVPPAVRSILDRIDVAYYEADAAEVGSLELTKEVGVEAAFDVLGVDDPFALVMGDSKSDLRVMEWVAERGAGIAAAPEHASRGVLDHVIRTDELVFDRGRAGDVLRTAYALNRLARLG